MRSLAQIILLLTNIFNTVKNNLCLCIIKPQIKRIGETPSIEFPICTYGLRNISIGNNFKCGKRLKLRTFDSWGGESFTPYIQIGDNVSIETDCHISAINSVIIEDGVLIASFVYISDHSHGIIFDNKELHIRPIDRPLSSKGPIKICLNVWIGEKVSILPGTTIGEGSIIGANSVVTHDIPPYCIAVGSPAKIIKNLNKS